MKVGDTGEAFFVFETDQEVPEYLQTSPLVTPVADDDVTSLSNEVSQKLSIRDSNMYSAFFKTVYWLISIAGLTGTRRFCHVLAILRFSFADSVKYYNCSTKPFRIE